MAIVKTDNKHYKDIANQIRDYSFTNNTYKPEEMAQGVKTVASAQYNDGHYYGYQEGEEQGYYDGFDMGYNEGEAIGYMEGRNSGLEDGREEGRLQGRDDFMYLYQTSAIYDDDPENTQPGSRIFAGNGWNNATFYPVLDIDMSKQNVFHYFGWGQPTSGQVNLTERLEECGVELIYTHGLGSAAFSYAWFNRVPLVDATNVTTLTQTFRGSKTLVTIDELKVKETNKFNTTFEGCSALKNITITGTIGNTISFSDSNKLTEASVLSIFNALKDYSGTTTKPTISLHSTVKSQSWFDDSIATAKGWDVA